MISPSGRFSQSILQSRIDDRWQQSQFLPKLLKLSLLERVHPQPPPFLRDSDQGRKGQLQTTLLIKKPRDHLTPSLLLPKRSLQQVRRPDRLAMSDRAPQVIQGGFQILSKGLHRRWIESLCMSSDLFGHFFLRRVCIMRLVWVLFFCVKIIVLPTFQGQSFLRLSPL
jgi:hypothetical protein